MIDFDPFHQLSLTGLSDLGNRLTDLLGQEVDITCPDWMYDHIRRQAQREAVLAF